MMDKFFAVYGDHLKDLSKRTEKVVTDKRFHMQIIAEETNVHQVVEVAKDSQGRACKLIYETDLDYPHYVFLDEA